MISAAETIRDYQAARGAIGVARRSLPPNFGFETRPDEIPGDSLRLPDDLTLGGVSTWMKAHAGAFCSRVSATLDPTAMDQLFEKRRTHLSPVLASPVEILVHFSGKDLLAALGPWLRERAGLPNPGELKARVRDWMTKNPEETLRLLPEWAALLEILKR